MPDRSNHDPRKRAVGLKLTVIARQLRQRFDQSVEGMGLSRAKFGVIAVVSRHPGATQRLIAETLEVSEVTAGRFIERLCLDGYLERREKPDDRRAYCVHLTPAAQPLLAQLDALATVQEEQNFAGISTRELDLLATLLDCIAGNIAAAEMTRDEAGDASGPIVGPDASPQFSAGRGGTAVSVGKVSAARGPGFS